MINFVTDFREEQAPHLQCCINISDMFRLRGTRYNLAMFVPFQLSTFNFQFSILHFSCGSYRTRLCIRFPVSRTGSKALYNTLRCFRMYNNVHIPQVDLYRIFPQSCKIPPLPQYCGMLGNTAPPFPTFFTPY